MPWMSLEPLAARSVRTSPLATALARSEIVSADVVVMSVAGAPRGGQRHRPHRRNLPRGAKQQTGLGTPRGREGLIAVALKLTD